MQICYFRPSHIANRAFLPMSPCGVSPRDGVEVSFLFL
jgi:hypothetical protein